MSNKYQHMREAWGLMSNPFPAEAIHREGGPFNVEVYPEEYQEFAMNLVHGAVMDNRGFGFLWSKGPRGQDTGFGKTTILKESAQDLNGDFGAKILRETGMTESQLSLNRILAAYTSIDTTNSTGIYPVLFSAAEYLADPRHGVNGQSPIERLRALICEQHLLQPHDTNGIASIVLESRRALGPTLPPLRPDALAAFVDPQPGAFAEYLSGITSASRIRSGLQYFDIVFTIAQAARVSHLFVFIDQLEDLANPPTVTKAKRTREVGRLRDIVLEAPYYVGHLHCILTMHNRAQDALSEMWLLNRLPSFDPNAAANAGSIVVLQRLQTDDQVRELLVAYLNAKRNDGTTGDLLPFEDDVLAVLRERGAGRVGQILQNAYLVFDRAAANERASIDGDFAQAILSGSVPDATSPSNRLGVTRDARVLDDILQ